MSQLDISIPAIGNSASPAGAPSVLDYAAVAGTNLVKPSRHPRLWVDLRGRNLRGAGAVSSINHRNYWEPAGRWAIGLNNSGGIGPAQQDGLTVINAALPTAAAVLADLGSGLR